MRHLISEQAVFLRAGGYTRRYHGWRTIKDDLVSSHSYNVANLVMLLRPDCRKELLMVAIRHDSAEWIAGDTPSDVKRQVPELKVALDAYEDKIFADMGLALPELTEDEYKVLKLADNLDGMMFCIQEREMGNLLIVPVYNTYDRYLRKQLTGAPTGNPEYRIYTDLSERWNRLGGSHDDGK